MPWTRPKEIVVIRHGESLRNKVMGGNYVLPDEEARLQLGDHYDHTIPLTQLGWDQSRVSGLPLIEEFGIPDCIYHSGYVRAQQTAEGLLSHLSEGDRENIRIYQKIELRERDPGYIWHMIKPEVDHVFPWLEEYHRRVGKFFYRPPGGQSIADLADGRIHSMIGTAIRDRPGQRVWFVCHGHVIRALRFNFERVLLSDVDTIVREPTPNVSITRYVYEQGEETPKRTHLNKVYW